MHILSECQRHTSPSRQRTRLLVAGGLLGVLALAPLLAAQQTAGTGIVAGGKALHDDGEDVAHAPVGVALGLLFDLADEAGGIVADLVLELLEQELLGLGGGVAGRALERFDMARVGFGGLLLAARDGLRLRFQFGGAGVQGRFTADEALLERVLLALGRIHDLAPDGEVIAITHGGVVYALEGLIGVAFERLANLGGRWVEVGPGGEVQRLGERVVLVDPDELTVPSQI